MVVWYYCIYIAFAVRVVDVVIQLKIRASQQAENHSTHCVMRVRCERPEARRGVCDVFCNV